MLAVFDLEGTLSENEFWDQFECTRGAAKVAMEGNAAFADSMAVRFEAVRGMPVGEFERQGDNVRLRPDAKQLFDALKAEGFTIAIASGGFDFFVRRISEELGAGYWIANRADAEGGRVCGIANPLVDGNAKREFVELLQKKLGITRLETIVVGDGANDVEMMAAAGLSIGFEAKEPARAAADLCIDCGLMDLAQPMLVHAKAVRQKPRVLLAGKLQKGCIESAKINAAYYDKLGKGELEAHAANFDVLVYRGEEKLDAEFFENSGGRLKLAIRPGVGVDHIDLVAAAKSGVSVLNTPTVSTISVAEHAIGLMLCALRKIPQAHASAKRGEWKKNEFHGVELWGKTVGIVGLGRIGRAIARRLAAFGVRIVGYDPFVHAEDFEDTGVEKFESLDSMLAIADIVTFHVPLTLATKRMMDARRIGILKQGAYVINTCRGEVFDAVALADAVREGRLSGAALDVFEDEPRINPEFLELDGIILTPHLGGSTAQAQARISQDVANIVLEFEANRQPCY